MILRSSSVSVPERMVRFLISSSVRNGDVLVAVDVAPSVARADAEHALLVLGRHALGADVAEAQELAVGIELHDLG